VAEARSVKEVYPIPKPIQHLEPRHYAQAARLAYPLGMRFVLGFDGGGTKTECVLMDETGEMRAKGRSGPSNPMRVGFDAAFAAVCEAGRKAIQNAKLLPEDVRVVCAGLAGAAQPESQRKLSLLLAEEYPGNAIEVCTDLDLTLEATGDPRAIVLIAGTGSGAVGRDLNGRVIRVGGHGPLLGDEGSAYDVGRHASIAALREYDRGMPDSPLAARILRELGIANWEDFHLPVYSAPDEVFPRIFPVVTAAADEGDSNARALLQDAAAELAGLVADLVARLQWKSEKFLLAKSGGMVGRSVYFDKILDDRLRAAAPHAEFGSLVMTAAEAAARMAVRLLPAAAKEGK
jgi:glucosamine kinase